MEHLIKSIGTICTPYKTKEQCPVQGVVDPDGIATVTVNEEYIPALKSIELFSHLYLFYVLDRAGEVVLQRKPFLDDELHGIFATRHPCRPNGIGISIVRFEGISNNILTVSDVDILDNTPIIDIKPYLPKFDARPDANNGWFDGKDFREKPEGRE